MEAPKFEKELNGYNIEQVDSFLSEINNELLCASIRIDCLANENKKLKDELLSVIEALSAKLKEVDNNDAETDKIDNCLKESVIKSDNETAKKDFEDFEKELQNLKEILR